MIIGRTHVGRAVVGIVTLLTVGVGWFAFGQNTNTPALTPGMGSPLVKDVHLVKEVENLSERVDVLEAPGAGAALADDVSLERRVAKLAKRVEALETTVAGLKNELNEIKKQSHR